MSMTEQPSRTLEVISGRIFNVSVEPVTLNLLDRSGDSEGMAATGVLAAAMGLSGPAAGMALMSSDDMSETVTKVTFEVEGERGTAVLAAWPFNENDDLKFVGARDMSGTFIALAVLDESKRLVSLYPHVSAGSHAHWTRVLRYSLWVGIPAVTVAALCLCLGNYLLQQSFDGFFVFLSALSLLSVMVIVFIGYRIGRRFNKFVRIAEGVFTALNWPDVRWIDLRKDAGARRLQGDPPALGESYFRY